MYFYKYNHNIINEQIELNNNLDIYVIRTAAYTYEFLIYMLLKLACLAKSIFKRRTLQTYTVLRKQCIVRSQIHKSIKIKTL